MHIYSNTDTQIKLNIYSYTCIIITLQWLNISWTTFSTCITAVSIKQHNMRTLLIKAVQMRLVEQGYRTDVCSSNWIMPTSPRVLWDLVQTMQYESLIPQHSPLMLHFVYCCCFRIKPAVWPNLPDHKKTLEQLCKKPKNVCSSTVLSTWV